MVHRDPETGQFLEHEDADEPLDLNYSDHEILNYRLVTVTGGGSTTANTNSEAEYQIESDVLDLENDELAMLSWLDTSMSLVYEDYPELGGEITRGGAYVNAEIGANLAGSEYLSTPAANRGVETIEEDDVVGSIALGANDEPGLWAHLNASASSGFKDADADGSYSGNSTVDNDRMRRVFDEETGSGPHIDATDDISIGIFVDRQGTVANLRSAVYGQMAFVIYEYENRRAEFAPYDPGISME